MSDPKRFRLDGDGYYIKSAAEMRELWEDKHGMKEACDNTLLIAERCEVELHRGQRHLHAALPGAREPDRGDAGSGSEVETGLQRPLPRRHLHGASRERAEFEMDVILQMGFPGYFLVVADFINWAKDNGIRVGPGRGSGRRLDVRLRRCGSPTSTRSSTACCSSASSTPSASRCPTSTSTSTSAGAAR